MERHAHLRSLWSGLTLGGKKGLATYGCPGYRNRYGCTNHLRIRCERATEQVSKALSDLLLDPRTLDYFIPEVYEWTQRIIVDGSTSTPRSCIISVRSQYEIPYLRYQRTQTRMISTGSDGV